MNVDQTTLLPIVDTDLLEGAYHQCAHIYERRGETGCVSAKMVLDLLGKTFSSLDPADTIDLFRRLNLTVKLVAEIDANWDLNGMSGARPATLPSALFEIAATELAFEGTLNGCSSAFFARDMLQEAFAAFQ